MGAYENPQPTLVYLRVSGMDSVVNQVNQKVEG